MHDQLPIVKDPFIPMDGPRKKLLELEKHIVVDVFRSRGLLYEFGRFLAAYISQQNISPLMFVIDCEHAMHDVQTGLNRRTRKLIQSMLAGQLPSVYKDLHAQIPQIAEAVFPEDFAATVKEVFQEFNQRAEEVKAATG